MESSLNTQNADAKENATIRPIDSNTVHKICSGQVVLSLAVAVKELVENSLDAGASCVDVRLKNYGMDSIEVSDNGCGVVEDNFGALTMKYHTSKLNEYSDLMELSSFGFRGEALSSLSALSDLVIKTRHKTAECATKIEYDSKGNIKKKTLCSRQVGTTVTLTNLFSSLPVRQKEFYKNAKREFTRMIQLLYAYCLIAVGVKITCTNQTKSSPRNILVATQGSSSYKDNIASVFGLKQLQSLLEIKPHAPTIKENVFKALNNDNELQEGTDETAVIEDVDIDLSEESNDEEKFNKSCSENECDVYSSSQISAKSQGYIHNTIPFEFQGFISTCGHGSGRSTTDKQFYFVNSRPCEPTKVIKLVNETYRHFNPYQYPFVFLNLKLQQSGVDVNVTPDKRKVFLTREKVVLDCIKNALLKLFENVPSTVKIEVPRMTINKNDSAKSEIDQPRIFNSFLSKFASKISKNICAEDGVETEYTSKELKRKSTTIINFLSKKNMKVASLEENTEVETSGTKASVIERRCDTTEKSDISENETLLEHNECGIKISHVRSEDSNNLCQEDKKEIMYLAFSNEVPNTQIRKIDEVILEHKIICRTPTRIDKDAICDFPKNMRGSPSEKVLTDREDMGKHTSTRKTITIKTSLEHVAAMTELYNTEKKHKKPDRLKFKSEINPVFNKRCEDELQREISKKSFKQMLIIGQFNLGFIISQLDDDLFIVDQHATDEIYNFETLQKTTELTSQKLVVPQQLDLSGVNEQILIDNLPVFTKNGFTFEIDIDAPPTKRVKLVTIPMSRNWIFGKDDIEEILFMLRETAIEHCRPSRVRAMFASRACRKSVMIGTALSKPDMKKLIIHMGEIEKPWNCPHGRPTIRHLVNLAMVHTD